MRAFGIEIRNAIIDYLKDNFNNVLSTVNTEKGFTTPNIKTITSDNIKGQLPALFIDLKKDDYSTEIIGNDVNFIRTIGTVEITIITKNAKKQEDYIEVYIETLLRVLSFANINVNNFTDIWPVTTERVNLYDKQTNLFLRSAIVTFEYQIN